MQVDVIKIIRAPLCRFGFIQPLHSGLTVDMSYPGGSSMLISSTLPQTVGTKVKERSLKEPALFLVQRPSPDSTEKGTPKKTGKLMGESTYLENIGKIEWNTNFQAWNWEKCIRSLIGKPYFVFQLTLLRSNGCLRRCVASVHPAPQPWNPNAEVAHFPVDFPTFSKGWGEWPPTFKAFPMPPLNEIWLDLDASSEWDMVRSPVLVKWNTAQQISKSQHIRAQSSLHASISWPFTSPIQAPAIVCVCIPMNHLPKVPASQDALLMLRNFAIGFRRNTVKTLTNSCTFAKWINSMHTHTQKPHEYRPAKLNHEYEGSSHPNRTFLYNQILISNRIAPS